ncbi:MAG: hypothetical protein IPN24_00155 [Betaproteobacteria bacterium]|nr:hypothetical protein [Betaproteobacteria bacterium]
MQEDLVATASCLPSAEAQLEFLAKLQRIFDEGEFTATYKFALLIALTQIAVEHGSDDNRPLRIRTTAIAEKFGELYWPQTILYGTGTRSAIPDILAQNLGKTARVISVLRELRASTGASTVAAARRTADWSSAVSEIARTVRDQPLQFLQNVGGRAVPFLYRIGPLRGESSYTPVSHSTCVASKDSYTRSREQDGFVMSGGIHAIAQSSVPAVTSNPSCLVSRVPIWSRRVDFLRRSSRDVVSTAATESDPKVR